MPKSRILYIENKADGLVGPARIGRVTYSKRGKTLHYKELSFRSLAGRGSKANFFCLETGDHYWISGPRKDGEDGLYGYRPVPIDEDVRDEYWRFIPGGSFAVFPAVPLIRRRNDASHAATRMDRAGDRPSSDRVISARCAFVRRRRAMAVSLFRDECDRPAQESSR